MNISGDLKIDGDIALKDAVNYSTSEKLIGKWTDGKKLYRTIIKTTAPMYSSGAKGEKIIDLSQYKMETVIIEWGTIHYESRVFQIPFVEFAGIRVLCNINGNKNLLILNNYDTMNNRQMYISLLYTKTTD